MRCIAKISHCAATCFCLKATGKPSRRRCRQSPTDVHPRERHRRRFLEQALLIIVLEEHELDGIGSKLGSRNIQRTRKDVEDMFLELGHLVVQLQHVTSIWLAGGP